METAWAINAEHSGDLGVATKAPRKGRPAATGRVLLRIVRCRLPGTLLRHPRLNAHSRYFAPAKPMALGTRTPNGRMMSGIYAGLPRNLNTELAAKTGARPAAVFCLETTAKLRPNTKPKSDEARHITPIFSGDLFAAQRRKGRPVEALQGRNELE